MEYVPFLVPLLLFTITMFIMITAFEPDLRPYGNRFERGVFNVMWAVFLTASISNLSYLLYAVSQDC